MVRIRGARGIAEAASFLPDPSKISPAGFPQVIAARQLVFGTWTKIVANTRGVRPWKHGRPSATSATRACGAECVDSR